MRFVLSLFLTVVLLSGCNNRNEPMERALMLREKLQNCDSCSFSAKITADYTDAIYEFTLQCETDKMGDLSFCVMDPQSIDGISGRVECDGGALTFDDTVLAFPILADGHVTPVSAPWFLVKALRGGYIKGCGLTGEGLILSLNDSYEENALQLTIYTNEYDQPVSAEIYWENRRIITIGVENFEIV